MRPPLWITSLALALQGGCGFSSPRVAPIGEDPAIAFVDVGVVSMTSPTVMMHKDVLIRGTRIERISDARGEAVPPGTVIINGSGKFLIPGLIDMHVHIRDTTDFTLYVANGITTVRVLRGAPRHLVWRSQLARDEMFGPALYSSGPFTNLPEIRTVADALRAATEQKATGYDFIKIHGSLPRDAYDTLVAAGRRMGIRVVGHAPRNLPFDAVLAAGQSDVSHLEEFIYTYFARQTDSASAARIPALAHQLATRGIAVTTTLVAYDRIGRQVDSLEMLLAEPQNRYVAPGQRASWERENNDYVFRFSKSDVPVLRERLRFQKRLAKQFVDSGVVVMLGTDAVGETWVPGWTAQEELRNLVDAGLSPYQALRAGTIDPARFLDETQSFGTIEEGKRADLVLLRRNPLESIANTQLIDGTMVRGKWYSAADLSARLARVDSANRAEERKVASLLSQGLLEAAAGRCDRRLAITGDEQLLIDLKVTSETTRIAEAGETKKADAIGQQIRARCPSATAFDESKLNAAGARLREQRKLGQAVAVYSLSEKAFPSSFLAPYFLGETLLQQGDTASALAAYRRSVVNDPQMMDAIQRIEQITKPKSKPLPE